MVYLLNSQIEEADAIVLNKIDLLSYEEREKYVKFLETNAPNVPVFAISAKEHKKRCIKMTHPPRNKNKIFMISLYLGLRIETNLAHENC